MTAYLATLLPVGFSFAPRGWSLCQGQLLAISQNQALFSLLGVNFGGNGTSNFALPDLRGRAPVGYGNGAGLPGVVIGQSAGSQTVTLLQSNIPQHNHMVAVGAAGSTSAAQNGFFSNRTDANSNPLTSYTSDSTQATQTLNPVALSMAGSGIPVPIMPPYTAINYIICLSGIFPTRN